MGVKQIFAIAAIAIATGDANVSLGAPTAKEGDDPVPKAVSGEVKAVLSSKSVHVTGEGENALRFWAPKTVETDAESEPIAYGKIEEGTILGVLEIKGTGWSDFRAQKLREGVFILRLALQPQDGDHMGVAPFPEFVALTPAEHDKSVEPLSHDELAELSKESIDTGHPAIMFLSPYFEKPTFKSPTVDTNAFGHVVLNVRIPATGAGDKKLDFAFGLIIEGKSDEAF